MSSVHFLFWRLVRTCSYPWRRVGFWIVLLATRLVRITSNVSVPKPGSGLALVRVFGSSVNPVALTWWIPFAEASGVPRGLLAQHRGRRRRGGQRTSFFMGPAVFFEMVRHEVCSRLSAQTILPCCRVRNAHEFSSCHSRLVPSRASQLIASPLLNPCAGNTGP